MGANTSVGLRAVATIIGGVLLGLVGYLIAMATGGTTDKGFALSGGPFFLWSIICLGYYIMLEALTGATLGKRLLELEVLKLDGTPIDWLASSVRNVLRIVDGLFFYLVGAIVIWTSVKKQRLGDRVAGTIVVRKIR
ncbi:MAG: RDD family protein [Betaproteobacteria bacterium]|nr:RDD family protein [Betaproteobacteria bacterium]